MTESKVIAQRFIAALGGEAAVPMALLAADATWAFMRSDPPPPLDRAMIEVFVARIASTFERFAMTAIPGGITAEGSRVAVEAESSGVTPDGRRYANRYHFLMVIEDGLIRSIREYCDTKHVADVFGE